MDKKIILKGIALTHKLSLINYGFNFAFDDYCLSYHNIVVNNTYDLDSCIGIISIISSVIRFGSDEQINMLQTCIEELTEEIRKRRNDEEFMSNKE